MIKTIIALCSTVAMLANAYAAPKLPKYGTEAWLKLPGVSEVLQAAEKGNVFAKYFLAFAAEENGNPSLMDTFVQDKNACDTIQNEKKLSDALKSFSEKGFYLTQRLLADVYHRMQLPDMSVALYRKAASQGDPIAQHNLGLILVWLNNGKTIPEETRKLWQASADQGHVEALNNLGLAWLKGAINGKTDYPKAIKYLTKAAEHGQGQALYLLGEIYEQGRNGKVDKDLAIKYYKAAAARHPMFSGQPDLEKIKK